MGCSGSCGNSGSSGSSGIKVLKVVVVVVVILVGLPIRPNCSANATNSVVSAGDKQNAGCVAASIEVEPEALVHEPLEGGLLLAAEAGLLRRFVAIILNFCLGASCTLIAILSNPMTPIGLPL